MEELIQGLRDLADFLEKNPDLPIGEYTSVVLDEFVYDDYDDGKRIEGSGLETMRQLARKLKPVEKDYFGSTFVLKKNFGDRVSLEFNASREVVCKRVVVGKKLVPARTIKEHEEEIVEWVCDEPLLK